MTREAFGLNDAAVLTSAVAGAASSAVFAGVVALAYLAGMPFPAVAGMEFPAVAEDLSLADDVGGCPPAVRVSEPLRAAAGADPLSDVETTPSVDLREPARPSGMVEMASGMPREVEMRMGTRLTVSSNQNQSCARVWRGLPVRLPLEDELHRRVDGMDIPHEVCTEEPELLKDSGEAIVVGAVGSAAPWLLTGWAKGVEVEFMIDTECQVMILAMSVFEKMCVSDLRVRSRLRPCGRRLVSADSSPLTVRREFDMIVVFPGLSCDKILVVASIGLDGRLGTEALQSCLSHQLEGRLMLQLHQQRQAPHADAHLTTSVVLPPNSEVVAPVSVRTSSWSPVGL